MQKWLFLYIVINEIDSNIHLVSVLGSKSGPTISYELISAPIAIFSQLNLPNGINHFTM